MLTGRHLQPFTPEVWGGMECSINRVGDIFSDQLERSGHYERTNDIERIASLGIKKLRFPILWERHQAGADSAIRWQQTGDQLNQLSDFSIEPIIGLVHHGSGPRFTNLADPFFGMKLANYAAEVIKKFPSLNWFTPINEPLTTARFSGLYGHWYPHYKSDGAFLNMLLNQVKGIVLSMKAIKELNPAAKLLQTEDLAKIHSTPVLSYQAEFENERRWLTFDLLCGKVNRDHPLWHYFLSAGIMQKQLEFFTENPCPPDMMGLNYYVTSERYLDEKISDEALRSGNGKHNYTDVAAYRAGKAVGLEPLLGEVWNRFGIPIAITEAHLWCTREEQMRWIYGIWKACCHFNKEEHRVHAITMWSLLGAYDWNTLLTKRSEYYESGAFDVRATPPRRTAVATMIENLAVDHTCDHPLLQNSGWWDQSTQNKKRTGLGRPLLIVGQHGALAVAFRKVCEQRNITCINLSRENMDINDVESIGLTLDQLKPWAVVNAAGFVDVDRAESDAYECFRLNTMGAWHVAKACKEKGLPYLYFSSDLVFDGNKHQPYVEGDPVEPINNYGRSKADAETIILQLYPSSLIVRTSAFFSPWDDRNFAHHILTSLNRNQKCFAASDVYVSPTYLPDLVNASLDLLIDDECGIWHLSNNGTVSWMDFARHLADRASLKQKMVVGKLSHEMNWKALRPRFSSLQTEKGVRLPDLHQAIDKYLTDRKEYVR